MSNVHNILRAYNEVKRANGKKDPSKVHGFQTCGIVKGEGRVEEFQQYFDPSKSDFFLQPGDYEVRPTGLYLDRDGRLQVGREFVLLKSNSKAA